MPLDVAQEVIRREVARHNAQGGRRGQGMNGRSYQAAFEAGLSERVRRTATARQLWLASLVYTPVTPDRWGRVTVDGWTYGGTETQEALLPYHKRREKVLLGRNPDDFDAPALAWNAEDRLICEGIKPQHRGTYGSVDGIRQAARNRKAAAVAAARAEAEVNKMAAAEYAAVLASLPTPEGPKVNGQPVVAGHFGGSLDRKATVQVEPEEPPALTDAMRRQFRENLERAVGMKP